MAASRLHLIIVSGLPGVGKSTLAEGMARQLGLPIFSVDPIESAILASGLKRSFETGLAAYLVAQTLADEQMKLGQSAIIDAVSGVSEAREMWHNLASKHQARLVVVECVLDPEVHKKRLDARVRNMYGIPEVTWQSVQARRKEYLAWNEKRLVVNTANDTETNLRKALEYVEAIHDAAS